MIGAALAMHYYGKKNWTKSIIFWAVVLVGGVAIGSVLKVAMTLILGAALFIGLAHYWYKFEWIKSIVLYAIAFVLDLLIMMVLGLSAIGLIAWMS